MNLRLRIESNCTLVSLRNPAEGPHDEQMFVNPCKKYENLGFGAGRNLVKVSEGWNAFGNP